MVPLIDWHCVLLGCKLGSKPDLKLIENVIETAARREKYWYPE